MWGPYAATPELHADPFRGSALKLATSLVFVGPRYQGQRAGGRRPIICSVAAGTLSFVLVDRRSRDENRHRQRPDAMETSVISCSQDNPRQ